MAGGDAGCGRSAGAAAAEGGAVCSAGAVGLGSAAGAGGASVFTGAEVVAVAVDPFRSEAAGALGTALDARSATGARRCAGTVGARWR